LERNLTDSIIYLISRRAGLSASAELVVGKGNGNPSTDIFSEKYCQSIYFRHLLQNL